jgi:hypothetical protein
MTTMPTFESPAVATDACVVCIIIQWLGTAVTPPDENGDQ